MRGLIVLILFVALALGWFSAQQRATREQRQQERRLRYAMEELSRARDELQEMARGVRPDRMRSFGGADFESSNLAGMTIASKDNAFQRASFRNCHLEGTTLVGGDASFQLARFDAAKLAEAHLKGGGASFQRASFVGAELTYATLAGGPVSFQGATFEGANLTGANLSGNFQLVNISGTKFEAADLSSIRRDDLANCYFKDPPTYDDRTKFPQGFDPAQCLWRRVE